MLWIQHRLPWITEQRLCIDHGYSGIVVAFWTCTCFGLLLCPVWFQIPSTISSPCSSCMVSIQLVVAVSVRAPEVRGLVGFASKMSGQRHWHSRLGNLWSNLHSPRVSIFLLQAFRLEIHVTLHMPPFCMFNSSFVPTSSISHIFSLLQFLSHLSHCSFF